MVGLCSAMLFPSMLNTETIEFSLQYTKLDTNRVGQPTSKAIFNFVNSKHTETSSMFLGVNFVQRLILPGA